jgi:UDP-N-acetylglucosamine 2-epimerase (non-hydrolysing)
VASPSAARRAARTGASTDVIHIVLGTKAQLVKMAPLMVRLRERDIRYRFVHTGQHRATMREMLEEFGLEPPDVVLYSGRDVVSLPQMAVWTARILAKCLTRRREIFGDDARGIVLVHGDTFSTLLGALMGRIARMRVGHVEAGLRSFHLFHPFPEEITRLLTFRLAHSLYCPGAWALANVAHLDAEKVDTGCNTLRETLELAGAASPRRDHVPDGRYALVSLHRYENIFKRSHFDRLLTRLEELAEMRPLLFILHPPTESQIDKLGFRERLERNPGIELRPRYTYFDFVTLLEAADFVVTDGGSIQEEASYLGVPCLLMRRASERPEGLGENAVLSNFDPDVIRGFVRELDRYRRAPQPTEHRPSDIILDSALRWA